VTPSSLVDGALVSPQPFSSMFRVVEILTVLYPTASSPKRRYKRLSLGKNVPTLDQRNFFPSKRGEPFTDRHTVTC
jgi:hypothetical protein